MAGVKSQCWYLGGVRVLISGLKDVRDPQPATILLVYFRYVSWVWYLRDSQLWSSWS